MSYVVVETTSGCFAVFGPPDNPRVVAACDRQEDARRIADLLETPLKSWRPVSEYKQPDLPDYTQFLAVNTAGYMACVTYLYRNIDGSWDGECETPEDCEDVIGDVTHWMPLPDSPHKPNSTREK